MQNSVAFRAKNTVFRQKLFFPKLRAVVLSTMILYNFRKILQVSTTNSEKNYKLKCLAEKLLRIIVLQTIKKQVEFNEPKLTDI